MAAISKMAAILIKMAVTNVPVKIKTRNFVYAMLSTCQIWSICDGGPTSNINMMPVSKMAAAQKYYILFLTSCW